MKSTEKETQKTILEYLELKNIFHWRQNSGTITTSYKGKKGFYRFASINGISDIIALKNSKAYFIEVKDVNGSQNENQKVFQENVEKAGSIYILAKTLEDVRKYL